MIIHSINIVDYSAADRTTSKTVFVQNGSLLAAVLRDSGYTKRNMPDAFESVTTIRTGEDAEGNPIMTPVSDTYKKITDPRYKITNGGLTFLLNPRIPMPPKEVPVEPPTEPVPEPTPVVVEEPK